MRLDEIRAIIDNSSSDDWHKAAKATTIFIPDIDISLDWNETINPNFTEPWHNCLHDPSASSVSVVLRHNGAPVDRWTFVVVDGGRYMMPLPAPSASGGYELPASIIPIGNLIFDLYHPGGASNNLSALLNKCSISVV
ncbi:MAG: hypothetical protein JJU29_05930 [Verrucomicrobia bacterium]|nr:hypothetical protein [Verrucomicrobiota bacterium]MCH8510706.1 hypothetical protein [Kiritimatiellia bacterium]